VAANLLPLAGVVRFGWLLHELLVVYWLENGVVGLANVPKILVAAGRDERPVSMTVNGRAVTLPDPPADPGDRPGLRLASLPVAGCVHYGVFWAVHGVFVLLLPSLAPGMTPVSLASLPAVELGAGALLVSHGVSLYANSLRGGEWRRVGPATGCGRRTVGWSSSTSRSSSGRSRSRRSGRRSRPSPSWSSSRLPC
jgi:hypothetical protein